MLTNRLVIFYIIIILGWLAGGYVIVADSTLTNQGLCFSKSIYGVSCPGCGMGRGFVKMSQFNIAQAFLYNPFSIIAFLFWSVLPLWLIADVIRKKQSLYAFYDGFNSFVKKNKTIGILLIVLILANWVWNIYKYD